MFDGRFWGAETPSKKKLDEAAALRCASEMRSAIDLRSQCISWGNLIKGTIISEAARWAAQCFSTLAISASCSGP
jgi:hypothetical protein